MQSIDLIRENLRRSRDLTLARIEEMKDHALVFPTPNGGSHTLWVLGHLTFVEGLVIREFMLGEENPAAGWSAAFDGEGTSDDPSVYPDFDDVLAACRESRERTLTLLDSYVEDDLDRTGSTVPAGFEQYFGTYRRCFQYVSDHWLMHRGNLADSRRAAGLVRMWV